MREACLPSDVYVWKRRRGRVCTILTRHLGRKILHTSVSFHGLSVLRQSGSGQCTFAAVTRLIEIGFVVEKTIQFVVGIMLGVHLSAVGDAFEHRGALGL